MTVPVSQLGGLWDGSPEASGAELFFFFLIAEVLSPNICLNSVNVG